MENGIAVRGGAPNRLTSRLAAVVGFGVAVAAIAALAFRGQLFAPDVPWGGVQILAVGLMLWARLTFGLRSFHPGAQPTAGGLVITGPYRYWRHPIYAAVIFFVAAGAIHHRSWSGAALAAVVACGLFVRMMAEERHLRTRYPDYPAYAARTARLIPGIL